MLVNPFHCICPSTRQTFTAKPRAKLCDQACKGPFISFMRYSKINNILAAAAQTEQNMQMELCRRTFICYSSSYDQQIRLVSSRPWWCDIHYICNKSYPESTYTRLSMENSDCYFYLYGFVLVSAETVGLPTSFCHTHSLELSFQPICMSSVPKSPTSN